MTSGAAHNTRLFDSRALNALRLEKSHGSWGREYRPVYGPVETGLDTCVAYNEPVNFIGRVGALQ